MTRKKAKTLADYEREHRQLAQRLARVGFLWAGSLSHRYLKCGNPRCACQHDPDARHGPYVYWSTKKEGKTVSRKLPPQEAKILEKWVENRRKAKAIMDNMMMVSRQAFDLMLSQEQSTRHQKSRP
jgi:hypothetical protein